MAKVTKATTTLHKYMAERNLTQSDVARMVWGETVDSLGYTVPDKKHYLSRWFSGKVEPSLPTLRLISTKLGIPIIDLVDNVAPSDLIGVTFRVVDKDTLYLKIDLDLPKQVAKDVLDLVMPYAKL